MATPDFLNLKSKTKLSCLNKLIPLIGKKPLNKIDTALLTKLRDSFSRPVADGGDGYAEETVIRYLNTISSIFTYAKNELEIPVVMPFVKKPMKPQGRDQRITDPEIDLIVNSTQSLDVYKRQDDTVARLGGDEYVVLLENLSEKAIEAATQVEAIGTKILAALNKPYQLGTHEHHSTPSIGAALFSDHTDCLLYTSRCV